MAFPQRPDRSSSCGNSSAESKTSNSIVSHVRPLGSFLLIRLFDNSTESESAPSPPISPRACPVLDTEKENPTRTRNSASGSKQTIEDLFGSKNFVAVVDLPPHLERLHQHTSHITRQNVTDILLRHTLYPLFAPFLGPEPAAKSQGLPWLSDYGGDVHTRAGIVASRLKRPGVLRVCPVCYREQVRRNAEACWQRLFQVTGVQMCPEHRVLLHSTPVPYVPFNKHEYSAVPELSGQR